MAAKNSIKQYSENGYYHVYNRGVAKGKIFLDEQDYAVFLSYLKEYLSSPIPPTSQEIKDAGRFYLRKNYHNKIELFAFCLMPNHFHFLLRQSESRSIEGFMRSLLVRYSAYFNKRHHRVGHLFQDVYKGILVSNEQYLLWLSRYIHLNPTGIIRLKERLISYPYSSYPVYLGLRKIDWVNKELILNMINDYRRFVEEGDKEEPEGFSGYILES